MCSWWHYWQQYVHKAFHWRWNEVKYSLRTKRSRNEVFLGSMWHWLWWLICVTSTSVTIIFRLGSSILTNDTFAMQFDVTPSAMQMPIFHYVNAIVLWSDWRSIVTFLPTSCRLALSFDYTQWSQPAISNVFLCKLKKQRQKNRKSLKSLRKFYGLTSQPERKLTVHLCGII